MARSQLAWLTNSIAHGPNTSNSSGVWTSSRATRGSASRKATCGPLPGDLHVTRSRLPTRALHPNLIALLFCSEVRLVVPSHCGPGILQHRTPKRVPTQLGTNGSVTFARAIYRHCRQGNMPMLVFVMVALGFTLGRIYQIRSDALERRAEPPPVTRIPQP